MSGANPSGSPFGGKLTAADYRARKVTGKSQNAQACGRDEARTLRGSRANGGLGAAAPTGFFLKKKLRPVVGVLHYQYWICRWQ